MNSGKGSEDPFFQQSGDQLIKAVIQLAKLSEKPDFLTCQKILALDPTELIDRVKAANLSPWINVSWEQFMSMRSTEKTSASVIATAALLFANFVSPDILPSLCGESTIPLDLEGKQMLVFGMDQNRRDIVGPIIAAVLHMIVVRNIAKQRKDPLAVFLDELPTIYLPSLVNWLNESRSAGFCGFLGFQNLSQLEKSWGKEVARAIVAGCNTKCIFNPGELESARYFSDFLGDEEIAYQQKSKSMQKGGTSRTVSEQEKTRKLVTVDEMLKLKPGTFILINPAYNDGKESNIPMKIEAKINPSEIAKEEYSLSKVDKINELMVKRRSKTRLKLEASDILIREIAIDRVIPPLPSEDEEDGGSYRTQSTYNSGSFNPQNTVNQMVDMIASQQYAMESVNSDENDEEVLEDEWENYLVGFADQFQDILEESQIFDNESKKGVPF